MGKKVSSSLPFTTGFHCTQRGREAGMESCLVQRVPQNFARPSKTKTIKRQKKKKKVEFLRHVNVLKIRFTSVSKVSKREREFRRCDTNGLLEYAEIFSINGENT